MPRYGRRTRLNRVRRRQFRGVKRTGFRRRVRAVVYRMSETKYHILPVSHDDQISVPTVESFSDGLAQGITAVTRIGTNIKVKRLTFKIWAAMSLADRGAEYAWARVLVIYPRKGVDDQSALTDINLIGWNVPPNPTTLMTLYDKLLPIGRTAEGNLPAVRCFKWTKRVRYQFNFDAAGAVKREPVIVMLTNLSGSNDASINFIGYKRLSFKDM